MKTKLRKFGAWLMAAALAFAGAGAYTANAGSLPSEGIYGFMRLSVASESIGKGKVSLNSNCQQNMSSATYWKDKDGPVLSGKDSTEPGLYYCDWKPAHPLIEFYVYAKPNDGYKIEGLYLDDECKHPISENAEILVDWFISGGQYSNVPEKIKSLIPYATYTPAEASMWALNVKTVDITKAQPTDIYVKFVAPVAKIEGKGEYVTLQAAYDAASDGDAITILSDFDLTEKFEIGTMGRNNLVIDLNGKTMTLNTVVGTWQNLTFANGSIVVGEHAGGRTGEHDWDKLFYVENNNKESRELKFDGVRVAYTNGASDVGFAASGLTQTTFKDCTLVFAGCKKPITPTTGSKFVFDHTVITAENVETGLYVMHGENANCGPIVYKNGTSVTLKACGGLNSNSDVEVSDSTINVSGLKKPLFNGGSLTLAAGAKIIAEGVDNHVITSCKVIAGEGSEVFIKDAGYLGINCFAGSVFKSGSKITVLGSCRLQDIDGYKDKHTDVRVDAKHDLTIEKGAIIDIADNVRLMGGATIHVADGKYGAVIPNTEEVVCTGDLTGGIYKEKPADAFVNPYYEAVENDDATTMAEGYLWKIANKPAAVEVYDASGAKIGEYVFLTEAVAAAEDGQTVKVIKPDTYKLPDFTAQVMLESVEGVSYNCKDNLKVVGGSEQVCGITKPVTFKGGSFDFGENIYRGFIFKTGSLQDIAAKVTFDGAYIKGIICGHGDLEFKDCTIEQISSSQYPIRSWGSPTITCTGCTFLTGGRAILVYREGYPNSQQTINVSGCHFLTKEGQTIDSKGAVRVNPADKGTAHYDVTISDCDASEAYTGLWDIKLVSGKGPDALILVDGDQVYPEPVAQIGTKKYSTLAEALAAVQNGETVKVLKSGNVVTEYAKQIDDAEYSEGKHAEGKRTDTNRLSFGTDAKFTLDLNGKTLTGRINFLKGDMTVSNGTLVAKSQAVNLYGTKLPENAGKPYTTLTIAPTAFIKGAYGVGIFGAEESEPMFPIGFGETVNVYGKIEATDNAIQSSGNIGMDTYTDNIGTSPSVEEITNALHMSVSKMMLKYGPTINVYDGADLSCLPNPQGKSQAIACQGAVICNVYGGKLTGGEALGVKGGVISVMGGELNAIGPKVREVKSENSDWESSGAGISVSTTYNKNSPVSVSVTGGTIKSANNAALQVAHSYSGGNPIAAVQGVSVTVAGGTFIGADGEPAIYVASALPGEEGKYPANFISAKLDEEGKETGYPLCNSPIPAEYIAVGYKEKDNENKTWTVTAMSPEIVVDPTPIAEGDKKYVNDQGQTKTPTDDEKAAADKAVKELETTYLDPVLTKVEGTGVADTAVEIQPDGQRTLKSTVVTALKEKAPAGVEITPEDGSNSWSHLVIKLKSTTTKVVTESETVKTSVNEMKVDVKPVVEVTIIDGTTHEEKKVEADLPQSEIPPEGISFPLFVSEAFRGKWALVKHEGDLDYETEVKEEEEGKRRPYVVVTATHFSDFILSVKETSSKTVKRESDGKGYDSFAAAIVDTTTAADETFTLLKDTEEVVKLGAKQTIVTGGYSFGGIDPSVLEADWTEPVNTDGKVFIAPVKANVPVSDETDAPFIRVRMRAADVTTPAENVAALKAIQDNLRPLWQNMALGVANNFKLIPMIPRSAIGFKTIKICSNLDDATLAAAAKQRDGVAVKFQLLKKVGAGDYVQCGEVQDKPVFNVEADDLEPRTFWKIQTIFSEEY